MTPTSQAYPGYGSKLFYSYDGVNYTPIAQLQKFGPSGSKQTIVDQTNLRSGGNFTQSAAVQVDAGEFDLSGIYSGDITQELLGQFHGSLALIYWRVLLTDRSYYSFRAYVSEFTPWAVTYNKAIPFSAKLRVSGGIESPLSGYQQNGFGNGFQQVLI